MSSTAIVLGISVAYLAVCLALGMWPGRKSSASAEGYVAGDRSMGLLLMYFITGATIFSAFAFLGGPGWAYRRGAAAFYILGYGALGFLPFYFLGPRAARVGRAFKFVTQAEMMSTRFEHRGIPIAMAIISVVAFVPYLVIQMQGAGYVLDAMTNGAIPPWAGAALVYGIVLIYVLKSGVLGVGWTNTFQGLFMMILAWVLGIYLPHKLYGGLGALFTRIATERPELLTAPGLASDGSPWGWAQYSSAVIVSIIGFSMWPHLFMKAFTAKDERTIRRTVVLYPTFQIFLVPLFIIGFCGVFFPTAPAKMDQIVPHILMNADLPAVLVGFFCAGALAASMSSGDAILHAAASILVRDGLILGGGKTVPPERERMLIRLAVLVISLVAYVIAVFYEGSLVFLLLSTYGAIVQFAPGVVACLYSRRTRGISVFAGMISGAVVTLGFTAFPETRPFAIHAGLYGLMVNLAVLGLMQRRTGAPTEAAEAFARAIDS